MDIGNKIRTAREAKGLTQKQVAIEIGMDQSQYSNIEKGKTDPYTSTVEKIAKALGMTLSELFSSDDIFREVNSQDKSLMEKLRLVELLEDEERKSVFNIIDGLFAKKKLKDTLSNAQRTERRPLIVDNFS
jgi:transcriptional regulator with XRE-family HTH domain